MLSQTRSLRCHALVEKSVRFLGAVGATFDHPRGARMPYPRGKRDECVFPSWGGHNIPAVYNQFYHPASQAILTKRAIGVGIERSTAVTICTATHCVTVSYSLGELATWIFYPRCNYQIV